MDLQLNGAVAIITGASEGIGLATAQQLLAEGASCLITGRRSDRLEAAVVGLSSAPGARVVPYVADIADLTAAPAVVDAAVEQFGRIDVLVNCAGRASGGRPEAALTVEPELLMRDFAEKVTGYLILAREVAHVMRAQGGGRIVNVGGIAARSVGGVSAGVRNAGVVNVTKALSVELARTGVRVNAVHPGLTMTRGVLERLNAPNSTAGPGGREPGMTHLGRPLLPSDVANVICFLASPASAGINGEVVAVTGGMDNAVRH